MLDWPYFEAAGSQGYEEEESYTGTGTDSHTQQYNFPHGLGEIINALIKAGLQIEFVHEHKVIPDQVFPFLVRGKDGFYRMPEGGENHLP